MARRTRKQRNARIAARRKREDMNQTRSEEGGRSGKRAAKKAGKLIEHAGAMSLQQRAGLGSETVRPEDWRKVREQQDDRTEGHDIRPEAPATLAPPVEGPIVWDYSRPVGAVGY